MKLSLKFPSYIEPIFAESLIAGIRFVPGLRDKSLPLTNKREDALYRCLHDPDMATVWKRATRYAPNFPARGQIELIQMILLSFPEDEVNYATEKEAEKWRTDFLNQMQSLITLWERKPANYDIVPDIISVYPGIKYDSDPIMIDEAYFLKWYRDTLERVPYVSQGHRTHVRGEAADRTYFIRHLSSFLKGLTGQWKRDTVATVTSTVYESYCTTKEVLRVMKGWDRSYRDRFCDFPDKQWAEYMLGYIPEELKN